MTTPNITMVKDGQYYYAPHRRMWGIWKHHEDGNGYSHGDFIKDVPTKEEASKEVYRLNGWKQKTN